MKNNNIIIGAGIVIGVTAIAYFLLKKPSPAKPMIDTYADEPWLGKVRKMRA